MKVFNGASRPIVVCGFVGKLLSPKVRLIFPRESGIVPGPDLPRFGLNPYELPGVLMVRDLGYVQLDFVDNSELALVTAGQATIYQKPFSFCPYSSVKEGVRISFYDESHLIGI